MDTSNNEPLSCMKCGKTFTQHCHLNRHVLMPMGKLKFYYERCRKGFADKTNSNEHVRRHEGLKYHCDYCGRALTSKRGYQRHILSDIGK